MSTTGIAQVFAAELISYIEFSRDAKRMQREYEYNRQLAQEKETVTPARESSVGRLVDKQA